MTFPSDFESQLVFNCGHEGSDVFFDNISLKEDISAPIEKVENQVVERFKLFKNFPNPFNPRTIINYELPTTITVDLSIYNLLGQKIAILVSEKQEAGYH
jgi:hypothetical protein